MNVTAFVHFSVPYRMAGSETMLHTMMESLAAAGHTATVVTSEMEAPPRWEWRGVQGITADGMRKGEEAVIATQPDVIVSHHQNAVSAMRIAHALGVKSVYIQHNDFPGNQEALDEKPDMVVFNTQWVAEKWQAHAPRSLVVHPPVWAAEHATTPGDMITMVNLNRDKGVHVFYQLAQRFPQYRFLGVTGSHGPQLTSMAPQNVEIIPQTTNMKKDVWSRTKILMVPSVYESYGMVAAEATASGIVVVAAPTPGLRESLGAAGIFIPRNQVAGWMYKVDELMKSEKQWNVASRRSLMRSAELDPKAEMDAWVYTVEDLAGV